MNLMSSNQRFSHIVGQAIGCALGFFLSFFFNNHVFLSAFLQLNFPTHLLGRAMQ